ncbi:MAG: transketolase C-terminal domain-containing protein [Clostridia bacterium]
MKTVKKAFTQTLLELAQSNQKIFALATDSCGSVTLDDFARLLPGQFVECGIAEQDAVGIAAGLSKTGLIPFVCGPASFYATRAAEQIKVDVAYSHTDVKVIGVSGGVSYGALGGTHHAVQDIALMRAIPGLQVLLPSDAYQMVAMTKALAQSGEPSYVRMGRGEVPEIYGEDAPFEIGVANTLTRGNAAAIIACGEMVYPALEAAKILAQMDIFVRVIDMHTIKPLDESTVLSAAETGVVLTVEEHSVKGGLGGAIAELLAQRHPVKMRILGLPDETLYSGTNQEVFGHYGLTPEGIAQAAREAIG